MERQKNTKHRHRRHNTKNKKQNIMKIIGVVAVILVTALVCITAYQRYSQTRNAQFQNQIDAVQNGQSSTFEQASIDIPLYVLIVGVDDNNPQQANFVALAAVNKAKKQIDFIMLPDDTKIEGRKGKGAQQLADIYGEGGLKLTQAVVEDIFHIPVPYYALFTQSAFKSLIDDNNGISMYVERDMYHEDNTGITDIDLHQGYQYLNGDNALGYMRYMDQDGRLARVQRQERFVKLFYAAMEKHFAVTNMFHMYRYWNYVASNITAKDVAKLCYTFKDTPVSNISFTILPGEYSTINGKQYWSYDPIEVQKIIGNTNNAIVNDMSNTNQS